MILTKTPSEIKKMQKAGRILALLLDELEALVLPGISTFELNHFAEAFIMKHGGRAAFKGYTVPGLPAFPAALCTSVNDGIVHGIPSKKVVLKEGDIIGVDVGIELDGYFSDTARTYKVGAVSKEAQKLLDVTAQALELGIAAARQGNRVGDISHAIESFVLKEGFYCADDLTGHGIGKALHEEPMIPNVGKPDRGPRLRAGMTIAIEPMVNIGTNQVIEKGWEFFTADKSLSAHFEHSILITANEAEILSIAGGI